MHTHTRTHMYTHTYMHMCTLAYMHMHIQVHIQKIARHTVGGFVCKIKQVYCAGHERCTGTL